MNPGDDVSINGYMLPTREQEGTSDVQTGLSGTQNTPSGRATGCPECGHADFGYGQEQGYVICAECDCGDPTNMVGPHTPPTRTAVPVADPFATSVYGMPRADWDRYGELGQSCPEWCFHGGPCDEAREAIYRAEAEAEGAWLRAAEASTAESDAELREHEAIYGETYVPA